MKNTNENQKNKLDIIRQKIYVVIYGINTPAGRAFDIALLFFIFLSVFVIMLETVQGVDKLFHRELLVLEWIFSILFTLEYALRIFCSRKPAKYIFSFYGLIDLLSLLPMFLSFFFVGTNVFSSLRILRLLRLFRVFRLMDFIQESSKLKVALLASRAKIMVFLFTVMVISIMIGTLMYFIEGPGNGFTSIPRSIFYTIVTLTTVGYGDMVPTTAFGQFLSMILMVIGYGIIAVPTGIVGVEIARQSGQKEPTVSEHATENTNYRLNGKVCAHCNYEKHRDDAEYCYHCGHHLNI